MAHDWMIDVLNDLAAFARDNDLSILADDIAKTTAVAARELRGEGQRGAAFGPGRELAGSRILSGTGRTC